MLLNVRRGDYSKEIRLERYACAVNTAENRLGFNNTIVSMWWSMHAPRDSVTLDIDHTVVLIRAPTLVLPASVNCVYA